MSPLHAGCLIACLLLPPAFASAGDWPHWRGPGRNDVVAEESGYSAGRWPVGPLAWKQYVGLGSTSPLVAEGHLYVQGWEANQDQVWCLKAATGEVAWKTSYPCPKFGRKAIGDQELYSGTTSTPEFDRGTAYLFTLSADGDLNCWNTEAQARKVWGLNLYDNYSVPQRPKVGRSGLRDYGYTSSPLVFGPWVIVEVGAADGNLIAFDKKTGQEAWRSQNADPPGHTGGPVPIVVEGVPCVAVLTFSHLLVARLDAGRLGETAAEYEWITSFANNIATPAVYDNFVLITSEYNKGVICKLQITLAGAKPIWEQSFSSKVCSPIVHDGRVYWAWRYLYCLDFATGKLQWYGGRFGDAGSCIITADDRLVVWSGDGDLTLAETARRSANRYQELARLGPFFKRDVWPHVVLADGRLYCKDMLGELHCYPLGGMGK